MITRSHVQVIRRSTGEVLIGSARWCSSRLCRLAGLQFRRALRTNEALILAKPADTILNSSIHMFFVFFPIAAVWINGAGRVTSVQIARPWRPYYASPEPARYVLETTPDFAGRVSVGDELDFRDAPR